MSDDEEIIKIEMIEAGWILKKINRSFCTVNALLSDRSQTFWLGYNKALYDLGDSIKRKARKQAKNG